MVSRRSVRIKSTSVLKKLKKRIGSKPKSSVGVQDVNLKQPAPNSQIDAARECSRTGHSSTSENKQKENKSSKNVADQEDSRIKSCTVLAVKLKYPYVGRTTSVKLNSKSTNKNSDSSTAAPRSTANSPETDLNEQGTSRKSSRMRKPTSKELKSVLISTDTELGLKKHNGEVSPQKFRNKSVKPQIINETSIPDQKAQVGKVSPSGRKVKDDDLECIKCGITPSQFFGRDMKHNTVCCFCSLVKPPQELKALLQLLKLDCCLKFLNQNNQNVVESSILPSRKRRMSEHTSSSNSDVKTLKEAHTVRAQKEHNQNSPEEPKQNTNRLSRPRQQKGNSSINLNKLSNLAKSPNSTAVNSTRISTRVTGKSVFPRIKPPTKSNKPKLPTIKDIHRNLKRKISPQATQNPIKRRKLTENVEVQKKSDREHICSSCNSTFEMQWKLKLHELTHADKRYPNVVLRHTEVEGTSSVTAVKGGGSEVMDCDPNNENATDKDSLNVQVSDIAVQQINTTTEALPEDKITSDKVNSKECGDDLEPSQDFRNDDKSALEDHEENANKDSSNDTQHTKITEANICDAPANAENAEVTQKLNELDSHDVTTNCDTPLDKDNVVVNEESDVTTKCDENPISIDSTYQSTKTKEDKISEKSDLSSGHDISSLNTEEHPKDKELDEINPNETTSSTSEEPKESENAMAKIDIVSDEDTAHGESEVENTLNILDDVREENENNKESEESIKAIEEIETHELSKTNEDDLADKNEESSNEICDNTAEEETEMHEDNKIEESSKMDDNCCKETVPIKNSSDHCEQKDESLVTENNSEDTANECRSEVGKIETKLKDKHDDSDNVSVSDNKEKEVNGTATDDNVDGGRKNVFESDNASHQDIEVNHAPDNSLEHPVDDDGGRKNVFESDNASHQEIEVNHAPDNSLEHPVDENMTELYNQMNIIFEGEPDKNKVVETETEKKLPDHHGGGDNSSE